MLAFAKRIAKQLFDSIFWPLSRREIRGLLKERPSGRADDIVPIANGYAGWGWYKRLMPFQVAEEYAALCDWAAELRPAVVVEIGTAAGATFLLWSRVATRATVSIDLPHGIHGGGYSERKTRLFREFVFDRPGVATAFVRASSQEQSTKDRVVKILGGAPIDLLYIDGDHRLEGVTRDFELWRDLVRPGGHIVFHDILKHPHLPSCQVDQLWQQIKKDHPGRTQEFVKAENQGWAGIGIVTME